MKNKTLAIFAAIALALTGSVIAFSSAQAGASWNNKRTDMGDHIEKCNKHGVCWKYRYGSDRAYARIERLTATGIPKTRYYDWYREETGQTYLPSLGR